MAYTNSPLVSYTKLSPNCTKPRNHTIDTITPHCVVGQASVEAIGNCFINTASNASCNYGIGYDGKVMLCVEEKNRSWCSSNRANDHRAITIECASDNFAPYAMKPAVYTSLVNLCVDICKRNGKTKLLWFGDKTKTLNYKPKSDEMLITVHRWFANKSCPGDWLYSRLGNLASEVTAKLSGGVINKTDSENEKPVTKDVLYRVRKSWADSKSQLGAYRVLNNAKRQADKNPGYYVFDESGNAIYPTTSSKPSVSPAPSTVTDADKKVWNLLKGKGLNNFAVAGIMGNLQAESGMKPTNLQNIYETKLGYTDATYTAAVDNGSYTNFVRDSAGYGLAQWTYWSRKQNLLQYAQSVNKSIGDLTMQVEFLWKELQGYKTVMEVLKSAKTVKEASDIILTEFERPADMGDAVKANRAKFGQQFYDRFASATSTTDEPVKPDETAETENTTVTERKATEYAQNFKVSASGSYKVNASGGLYIRNGAGVDKKPLGILPNGLIVKNYGYYTYLNGVSWMYVVAVANGVRYTGFCAGTYLTKL